MNNPFITFQRVDFRYIIKCFFIRFLHTSGINAHKTYHIFVVFTSVFLSRHVHLHNSRTCISLFSCTLVQKSSNCVDATGTYVYN